MIKLKSSTTKIKTLQLRKFCFRKTVIVRNPYQREREEKIDSDYADFADCPLNLQEIENLYTMEEAGYFNRLMNTFYDNWKLVSFGPEFMNSFINWTKNPGPLTPNYFKNCHKVTR